MARRRAAGTGAPADGRRGGSAASSEALLPRLRARAREAERKAGARRSYFSRFSAACQSTFLKKASTYLARSVAR